MSIQGVFNTEVSKATSPFWVSTSFVQLLDSPHRLSPCLGLHGPAELYSL